MPGDHRGARIRVGVIDSHDLLLAGARALMSMPYSPAEFVVGANTVDRLCAQHPELDVVLLDIRLADKTSAEDNTRRLSAQGWKVLLHADSRQREAGSILRRTPACGVASKNDHARTLLEAIVTVARGDTWAKDLDNQPVDLTHRETQVLRFYAAGQTYAQTAQSLDPQISVESVKTYLSRIRKRYDAAGRPASTRLELRRLSLIHI